MRNYIGKKCEQSMYLNPKLSNYHPENEFKTELFHWKRNCDIIKCKNIILKSVCVLRGKSSNFHTQETDRMLKNNTPGKHRDIFR